ncbi:MAG: DNA/RNA nuclease SfsA [Deltaproteobacteria bacterium]|nr:DNA/RNA nuclease SfsA [Candidatus Zymogenaceae bacterium]
MKHRGPLIPARFIARDNRLLARVMLDAAKESEENPGSIDTQRPYPSDDPIVSVHVPNSGRLTEILTSGRRVYLRGEADPKRKTAYTLVLARMETTLVSIESTAANGMARECFTAGRFDPFRGYNVIEAERRFGKSRFDFFLSKSGHGTGGHPEVSFGLFVEVKGVTLVTGGQAMFPDAPTIRGTKHLLELIEAVREGHRAAVLFVAQRGDVEQFTPNDRMDPAFGEALRTAGERGVEIYAVSSNVTIEGMEITGMVPVLLD